MQPFHRDKSTLPSSASHAAGGSQRTKPKSTKVAADKPAQSRRENILLAAERLFAQRGYHAVSIRDVAAEAGVPSALVGYHFGQKHELFDAIFEHWSGTRGERLSALASALAETRGAPEDQRLTAIINAFVQPVLRLRASAEGEYYAMLVGRELSFNHPDADSVLRQHFDPLADAFINALKEVFAQASRGQLAWCYQFALGSLLHHLTDLRVERLSNFQSRLGDPIAQQMLVQFLVGGIIRALVTTPPASDIQGTKI